MNSGDSLDEEFLDDPITLIEISDSESEHNDCIKGGYKSSCTSFVPVTFFDISNNVRLLNDCRPLFIKAVDCVKHPWYYKKTYKKDCTGERNVHEDDICNIYIINSDDSSTDKLIDTKPIDESESDSMESYEQGSDLKTWSVPKHKKIEYSFKRITSTKSILTIKRNKNSKKRKKRKSDVDFKRNRGLIGLKITKTTNIIKSHVKPNEMESFNNEHGKVANSKQLDLYISDVDKPLKQVDTDMYPIIQSPANIDDKDNKTTDTVIQTGTIKQSLLSNTNMKSLSPVFPCKPLSNKNMRTNINHISSVSSLAQPKILTDDSFNLNMTSILDNPRVIEAAEKIEMENVQESARSFHATEKQKVSLNSINSIDKNNENAEISNTPSQIQFIQTSISSQESSSPIVTKPQSITQHNQQRVVNHQSESSSFVDILNAKQRQPMMSHNYYDNYLSQNNLPNKTTTLHMCSIHQKPIGGHCSEPHEKTIPSYLIPNQKYSETNVNYLNYMNVVVGMGRNHAPTEMSNISQTQYPELMQRLYNNIPPRFNERHQVTDYFRMRPNFSNITQYANFNHQNLSRPYMYQPNLPRYSPTRPPPPPPASTPMESTPLLQNVHQIIPPQFLRKKPSMSATYFRYSPTRPPPPPPAPTSMESTPLLQNVPQIISPQFLGKKRSMSVRDSRYSPTRPPPHPPAPTPMVSTPLLQNAPQIIPPQFLGKKPSMSARKRPNPRKSKTVDSRQFQAVTDSAKIYDNVHSTLHGNSSKVDKHINKQNNLKKSALSLSQTVNFAKSKVEMLQELEKEMMNIHCEIDGIDDNISKAPAKNPGESRNIDKHGDTTETRNLYNLRQNNVFDIPFKLQETVRNYRRAQNVNSTIKDDRNFSGGLVPRNDMKRLSLHKPSGSQDPPVFPLSKKARVAHISVGDKNDIHMNTHCTINVPKPSKGYSPPILPIPSYDKTLQILTCATFEAKKYLEKQKKIEMEKNYAQRNADKKSVKTTEYFKSYINKQDKGKKISLEEYKSRKSYEPIMKNVSQKLNNVESNVSNCQNNNFGDASRISELDQGYGSDTVTI